MLVSCILLMEQINEPICSNVNKLSQQMAEPSPQLPPLLISTTPFRPTAPTAPNDTRTNRDLRTFLVPKHNSLPITLEKNTNHRRFTPHFDQFDLTGLFSKKDMTEEQISVFQKSKLREQEYMTPEHKRVHDQEWGSFSIFDKPIGSTISSCRLDHGSEPKRSRPKQKGLRKLSQRAYEIVLNLRSASYKEVANRLVDELNSQRQLEKGVQSISIKQKDEQNIKRRVYDALNVLIALGVLRKEGRKIVGDRDHLLNLEENLAKSLRREVSGKEELLKLKHEKVQHLQKKRNLLQNLIQKNQEHPESHKINFPFLVLENEKQGIVEGRGQGGMCQGLKVCWPSGAGDRGNFDVDFLLEYNKHLSEIGH